MLPIASLNPFNYAGQTHQGLVEDISTRSLQSVRIGEGAGKIQEGIANAFVGYEAGRESRNGSYITFVGYQAGYANASASYGTFVGAYAGRENNQGSENVFVGYRTGEQNKGGSQCVGVGAYAMRYNDSGNNSVAVGYAAGERCLDGSFNTMIGAQAGQDNRSGNYNTMAGYRSGRSAFLGNSNTYFGAYAGYSNTYGDANCFIGFRAGEALSSGNFNIAIGSYSLANATQGSSNISIGTNAAAMSSGSGNVFFGQNAGASNYAGDLNVIIGADAGLSNQGDKNVIIGESSAPVWMGDGNVLIGAEVAHHGTGYKNVIVGFNTASENYRTGSNNIFIGSGSDATRSNVENAISIGTCNVSTTSDSITVGKNIENTGLNSVSLGFSINTNAQNSVLVGEALNITSATYFNDPLNIEIVALIQSDALLKFGISNILYDNGILGTIEAPYATAEFGYNTSNLYNSSMNANSTRISGTNFKLAAIMGYHTRVQGCNVFYTDSNFTLGAATAASLTASNAPVYLFETPAPERAPLITAAFNQPLMTYASNTDAFATHLTFANDTSNFFIQNVFSCNVYERDYKVRILKHTKQPYIQVSSSNPSESNFSFQWAYESPPGCNLPRFEPASCNWLVLECPQYGRLNRVNTLRTQWTTPQDIALDYTAIPTALLTSIDTCGLLAADYLYDAASNLYGISSNVVQKVPIPILANNQPTLIVPGTLYSDSNLPPSQPSQQIQQSEWTIDRQWFMAFQHGDWAKSSNVIVSHFDDRFRFYSNATDAFYSCNQNLYPPEQITYTIESDCNAGTFIFEGSNDIFYIGNTYVFQQFSPCNTDYPLRFATEPDGQNNSDYTSNITYTGTPGTDGVITVLITADTPSPLYYYASNQVGWGGSNEIQSPPFVPVHFPYEEILHGCNAFVWFGCNTGSTIVSAWNGETLQEPFAFQTTFQTDSTPITCNIQVELKATHRALWEDPSSTGSSNVALNALGITLGGWAKIASNIFIEQYPTHGILIVPEIGTTITNLSQYRYQPLNPWDSQQDPMSFFLQDTTGDFKRYSYAWNTTPGSYQSSNHWVKLPTTITELSSNATYVGSNETTSILYHTRVFSCNIQPLSGSTISFPPQTTTIPIGSYNPIIDAQKWVYSNVLVAHRLEIAETLGSNITTQIDNVSNIDILIDTNTSNVVSYSNVVAIVEDGTYTNPHSNHIIETIGVYTTTHRRVYDSNYTVETAFSDTSNMLDAPRNLYLYQTQAIYPKNTEILISTPEVSTGASVKTVVRHNYLLERVYEERRGFHPLVQSALYHSNTHLWLEPDSEFWLIESNVGRVAYSHASNLKNPDTDPANTVQPARLWLDAKTPYVSSGVSTPIPALFKYRLGLPSATGGLQTYTAPYSLWSAARDPSPYTETLLANYRNRAGTQWFEMNAAYQASLVAWETTVRPMAFTPTHLCIVYLKYGYIRHSNTTITGAVHRLPLTNISSYVYQATGRYETDTFEWFYLNESTGEVSVLNRQTVFLRFVPELHNQGYTLSHTISHWNPLGSNVFFATAPETATSNLYIRYDVKSGTSPLDFYRWPAKTSDALAIYSVEELGTNRIYASIKSSVFAESLKDTVGQHTLSYGIYGSLLNATLGLNVLDSGTFTIPLVPFYDFPQPIDNTIESTLESLYISTGTGNGNGGGAATFAHCNVFYGMASNHLAPLIDIAGTRSTDAIRFVRTQELSTGRLTRDVFTETQIASHSIDYIPYHPAQVSNETLHLQWVYRETVRSPEYQWELKNYWFVISPQPTVPYRELSAGRTLNILAAERSVISQGFREDIAKGLIEMASNIYTYPYHSNTLASNTVYHPWNTAAPNISYVSPMTWIPVAYSFPLRWNGETVVLSVEQAGSVELTPLLSTIQGFQATQSYQLNVYVDTPPLYGLLRHESNTEVGAWKLNDFVAENVVYQHLGYATPLIDTFTLRFGTHPYDVSLTAIRVEVIIAPLPRLVRDREDYIYGTTQLSALSNIYGFDRTLTFETPDINACFMHTLSKSNIETVWEGITCNTLAITDLVGGTASNTGYRLTPDFFSNQALNPSRTAYDPLNLRFSISTREDPSEIHRLTYEPLYSNLIVYDWSGSFNALSSSNLIVAPFLASNSQKIEYDFQLDNANYQDMTNLETNFSFLVEPYNDLVDTSFFTSAALQLYKEYFNVRFLVEFLGPADAELCRLDITYQTVSVNGTAITIPNGIQQTLLFNQYSLWSLVFNDGANGGYLSIYINPNQYLSNRDNQTTNVLANQQIVVSLNQLSRIRILSFANDALNYTPSRDTWELYAPTSGEKPIYKKLELTAASHRLYFKNVELSTKIATQDAGDVLSDTYNIALGKNIQVKGEDNICLGTNFSTLGKYSIIIGNNIGQSVNFVNQVYQSIIIGNTSFQDSIIRNITAIGSGLMNNLYAGALPNLTDQIINQFISKRPILIGNDIGPEKVDYHVNVANTIMRTSVGNTSNLDQIYLGNEGEVVAVGYTSNENLQGPAKFYVKGDMEVSGIRIPFQRKVSSGGTLNLSLDTFSRGVVELSSNTSPAALTLQFGTLTAPHIGKDIEVILWERSAVSRALIIDSALKFTNPRPTATTANSMDRLRFTVIDTGLALATYTADFGY